MFLEGLVLLLITIAVCVIVYRGAVHEFQILQKDYAQDTDWSAPLSEQLPIILRDLPKHLLGGWTAQKTGNRQWPVYVRDGKRKLRTTWSEWIKHPNPQPINRDELATAARFEKTIGDWGTDGIRRWSWLPGSTPQPYVLPNSEWLGVTKGSAEFTTITATDGIPIMVWVAHEGAIPENDADELRGKNPWTTTSETVSWISEVKFIEVKLRPGNAILIPKHWWYAVAPDDTSGAAWFWISEFHTPISWLITKLTGRSASKEKKMSA